MAPPYIDFIAQNCFIAVKVGGCGQQTAEVMPTAHCLASLILPVLAGAHSAYLYALTRAKLLNPNFHLEFAGEFLG